MNSRTRQKIEKTFAAVAFTDVGEHETAIRMAEVSDKPRRILDRLLQGWNAHMAAIAFAEAGEFDEARRFAEGKAAGADRRTGLAEFLDKVGLANTKVCYGTITVES